MPNFKKGFSPVLIILVIAGLLSASFIAYKKLYPNQKSAQTVTSTQQSSAPNETVYTDQGSANWKTYTNSKYGFSIKYLQKSEVKEYDDTNKPEQPYDSFNIGPVTVTVASNLNKVSLDSFLKSSPSAAIIADAGTADCIAKDPRTKKDRIKFNGHEGISLDYYQDATTYKEFCPPPYEITYTHIKRLIVANGQFVYGVSLHKIPSSTPFDSDEIKSFSTFKFTN